MKTLGKTALSNTLIQPQFWCDKATTVQYISHNDSAKFPLLSALHSGGIPCSKLTKQKQDETIWEEILPKVFSANTPGESKTLSPSNRL